MAQIKVSYGEFNVIKFEESRGVKVYNMQGLALWAFADVEWWDKDGIVDALENNKEAILQREKEKNEYIKSRVA